MDDDNALDPGGDQPTPALGLSAAVDRLACDLEAFLSTPWAAASDHEVLGATRRIETLKRRFDAMTDVLVVGELDARCLAGQQAARSTAGLLSGMLRLSGGEAARRVREARLLGPRVTISGQVLAPELPAVAESRLAGELTSEHVGLLRRTLQALPATTSPAVVARAEKYLVEQAMVFDAATLRGPARQLLDTINPDGRFTDPLDRARRRWLSIQPTEDGMYQLRGLLDPACGAMAQTVLHALAAPGGAGATDSLEQAAGAEQSGGAGHSGDSSESGREPATAHDDRSSGQRLHDALRVALKMTLLEGRLPDSGGLATTVVIAVQPRPDGGPVQATTGFGVPIDDHHAAVLSEEAVIGVAHLALSGRVLDYGDTKRLADKHQTRALILRDKGCTFPGCHAPPQWTERHHIVHWRDGGLTNLDNLTLICDRHHDQVHTEHWAVTMRDGHPWYTPPSWRDPGQAPQRNVRW